MAIYQYPGTDPESLRAPLDPRLRTLQRGIRVARGIYNGIRYGGPVVASSVAEMYRRRARANTLARARGLPRRSRRLRGRRYGRRTGGRMLTTQADQQLRYAGRGRRPRAFVRRVRRAVADMQASNVYTVDGQKIQSSTINQTAYWGTVLSATTVEDSEITNMFTDKYGVGAITNTKICLRTQCLDVEIKNNSSDTCVLDVYEVRLRKACANSTIEAQYTTLYNVPATSVAKSPNDPGSSPFTAPEFCRMWKILSKREVRLGAGEIVTMQKRVGGDKWVNGYRITTEPGYLRGAVGYFFHWHGAPTKTAVPDSKLAAIELLFNYQKQYMYAIPPGQTQDNVHNA